MKLIVLTTHVLHRYDGQVPGPTIYADQGVQALIRLTNHLYCPGANRSGLPNSTSTPTPSYFKTGVFSGSPMGPWDQSITLHVHGSSR